MVKKYSFIAKLFITINLVCFYQIVFANESKTQVGRYLAVENHALPTQRDLLSQTFHVHFPASVKTVGDAIQYLLRFTGYSLTEQAITSDIKYMLRRPLPLIQRNFGPMTLEEGLTTLAGNTFQLLIDPVHRLISFQIKDIYSGDYKLSSVN